MKNYLLEVWNYEAVAIDYLLNENQKEELQEYLQEAVKDWLTKEMPDHEKRVERYRPYTEWHKEDFKKYTDLDEAMLPLNDE